MPSNSSRKFVIHPAIGVGRVGNSPSEFHIGPEVPHWRPALDASFKDSAGRVQRQAARFRVYEVDDDGKVLAELTSSNAQIEWTVHIANCKAAWYDFDLALDIPEATGEASKIPGTPTSTPVSSTRRNANVIGTQRAQLIIDPGPRSISGANTNEDGNDPQYAFESGTFYGKAVPLGELRTDASGNLLVLGGFGESNNAAPNPPANTFANNDGWHDDVADGPVDALITIDGNAYNAVGAWVVIAPPDFAPGLRSIVTMHDVVMEAAIAIDPSLVPATISFRDHILPILAAHVHYQWVNAGFLLEFGTNSPSDFLLRDTLAKLADPSAAQQPLRHQVFRRFRDPSYTAMESNALPPVYGDGMDIPPKDARQWLALTSLQHAMMKRWAAGDFVGDLPDGVIPDPSTSLDEIPLQDRPRALDRAALENCIGGPFHPGCEMTWPLRHPQLYDAPFRLRRRHRPEPDWGDAMTSKIALHPRGPLAASAPGALTRWMAVPWQTDTSSCLSAYVEAVDEYLPTFWPVRVPNDVLPWGDYQTIMDPATSSAERTKVFAHRHKWLRDMILHSLGASMTYTVVINHFIEDWYRYGIIAPRPGPSHDGLPNVMWVETDRAPELDAGQPAETHIVTHQHLPAEEAGIRYPNPRHFR